MIDLQNKIWKTLDGGYKIPYDVSDPLRRFESTDNKKEIDNILSELWDELHHQGDVGTASYLAVSHLVRIATSKKYFDWKLIELCTLIEQQRHQPQNPELPQEFMEYYLTGLNHLKEIILSNIGKEMDDQTYRLSLAGLATISGRTKLGTALTKLDDDVLDEFLEQY